MNITPNLQGPRYHYMDNIRALAMIGGVFFHVAMAYMPLLNKTYVLADPYSSSILEYVALYLHLFRMPMFMLVAGFFAHFILVKRGTRGFIKNRLVRVSLPFLIFFPLTVAAIIAIIFNAAYTVDNKPAMLHFLIESTTSGGDDSKPPPSTFHLWFLYNLMMFYTLGLLWNALSPIDITASFKKLSLNAKTTVLIVGAPLLVGLSFFIQSNPPIAPPDKLYPQVWAFLYHGVFFFIGWVFYAVQDLLDKMKNYATALLLVSTLLFSFVYMAYPSSLSIESLFDPTINRVANLEHAILAVLQGAIAVYATLSMILLGQKYLSVKSKIMRYFSDASYWLYLSHIPVVMVCHMILIDAAINVWLKYLISCTLTFVICILSYQILVRYTPIGWMLNGKRRQENSESDNSFRPTASPHIK